MFGADFDDFTSHSLHDKLQADPDLLSEIKASLLGLEQHQTGVGLIQPGRCLWMTSPN